MPERAIGSIWTVARVEEGMAVVLAGPFAAARGTPEYLVAPLYSGNEPGFEWTNEDVRLEANESGLQGVRYAAIWNARPGLQDDLVLEVGLLPESATADLRDVYWASLNERVIVGKRIGKPIRSGRAPVAQFQRAELARWAKVSGRVLALAESEPPTPPSLVSSIAFTISGAPPPFTLRTKSMAWLLCADPSSIADTEVLGESVPYARHAASMGRAELPPSIQRFQAPSLILFEGRVPVGVGDDQFGIEYARCA